MYILGEEAMVSNSESTVAGGHVAWSTCDHLPYCGHCHPRHHCGYTNLHGPKGKQRWQQPTVYIGGEKKEFKQLFSKYITYTLILTVESGDKLTDLFCFFSMSSLVHLKSLLVDVAKWLVAQTENNNKEQIEFP